MHLFGCLYYLYQWCTVKQISYNEIYLLIKYIKSVLWGVAKRLSYIEDARCLKVNISCQTAISVAFSNDKKLEGLSTNRFTCVCRNNSLQGIVTIPPRNIVTLRKLLIHQLQQHKWVVLWNYNLHYNCYSNVFVNTVLNTITCVVVGESNTLITSQGSSSSLSPSSYSLQVFMPRDLFRSH